MEIGGILVTIIYNNSFQNIGFLSLQLRAFEVPNIGYCSLGESVQII